MRQIKLNRQKLGVEDLLFGTGTEEQTRGNQQAVVTRINAGNLPFDETRSLIEFAQQVNLELLGNSITELLNINTNLSTFLTVEDNLGILTIIEESITNLNSLYTNLQAILDVNANESNINSVQSNESNINTLSSSITNLNSLYTNLQAILDVNANKSNINAVNTNESNINAVNTNESNINTIVTNLNALLTIFDNLSGLLNIDPYQFNKIGFKTNINETVSIGQVAWNQQESTIDVGLNSEVTLQVGQEELVLVKNVTGTTINNGKVVMVVGSNGNSGNLLVALHDGTKAKAVPTLGITTQDIANDTSGFVTKSGKVRGINTSGSTVGETWVDGDVLYVSTNGNLTKVVPGDTALKMAIAVVINAHGSNGTLFVRTNGLDENHDKDWVNTSLALKANTADLKEIGVGQTWQDVTANRSKYITYTNTTNKPIFVSIRLNFGTSTVGVVLQVNGITASAMSGSNLETMFYAIVPPGYTYGLYDGGGIQASLSISGWSELR